MNGLHAFLFGAGALVTGVAALILMAKGRGGAARLALALLVVSVLGLAVTGVFAPARL